MLRNFLTIAVRNLLKNKGYSFINISGLALGMAVALLIGLWMADELTFNHYHKNHDRIAQVWQNVMYNGEVGSQTANPWVMAEEIRTNFGSDFKYVLQSTWNFTRVLAIGDKKFNKQGYYFEPEVIDMLSLKMLKGSNDALRDPYSIILSESTAKAFFGDVDPMGQVIRIDNDKDVKVTGIFEDLPYNSTFNTMYFVMPWELYVITNPWMQKMDDKWDSNFTQTFVQLNDNVDVDALSVKIKDVKFNRIKPEDRRYNPQVFLHPMAKWHLFSEFKQGKNTGGRIEFVWLFGIIGVFVLLLACINFMNLSTARSEKRAKEVGIRKSIGSMRTQLVAQFFAESLVVTFIAFLLAILLVWGALPFFNPVADKKLLMPWLVPAFWLAGISFSALTGIVAGSYPALYLSGFNPVQVLKGTFRAGRMASLPRQVLVVIQFTVSVTLIIGTAVVFRQVQHARNRPVGYDRSGLITIHLNTGDIHDHYETVRQELKTSGAIAEMTESGSPITNVWNTNGGFEWKGKDPGLAVDFPNNGCTYEYGKTVGWTFKEGRDFSRDHATDSLAFVINEAAARFLGFEHPVGEELKWNDKPYTIIGVVNNIVVESPYEPVRPSLYHISRDRENLVMLKLNPNAPTTESIEKIKTVFSKYNPAEPFEYTFVDVDYARKFSDEQRVGKLASFFAGLAVFISCLGIFGLASFVAEQRTKEIGVRKVLGASVTNLWAMLSRDFLVLVLVSLLIALPLAYYFMSLWLEKYQYHTDVAWWILSAAGAGALLITLLTVSYQSVKAAKTNPVKSLRTE